jgi:hypothetical protein
MDKEAEKKIIEQRREATKKELAHIVTRQTTYTYEEAREKLENSNFDPNIVIREYMGIKPKKETSDKETTSTTVNQGIYSQIRGLMDDAATSFRRRQEIAEAKQKYIEQYQLYKQKQQEQQEQQKSTNEDILAPIPEESSSK